MGNTNIPQDGAADTRNSRDTLTSENQLTDEQRRQRSAQKGGAGVGPSPSRPKDAPARIPGQSRGPASDADRARGDSKRDRRDNAGEPAEGEPDSPRSTNGAGDSAAYEGHANTGHSPPGAS
ncbi:hypothetical protein ACFPME_15075 [Rhodanobacter umsongensis]|uniref:Uncharacterized protein n=1 Tax=Rhodanobacter umsongensis TaxID=633153 RepID=A0ABW0JP62_9GAMM